VTPVLKAAVAGAVLVVLLAGCGSSEKSSQPRELVIAVDAPFSSDSYLGTTIENGVRLGSRDTLLTVGGDDYRIRVVRYDNAHSASRAVADVRRAVAQHAAAIVSDGTGIDAAWKIADRAHIPIAIVFDGGTGLVDPAKRPNVFRIAPTDHGVAFRFAEYLIPKKLKVAFLTDDTGYGREGRAALDHAFSQNASSVAARVQVPSTATDLAPQILQARRSGATALLVWGQPSTIAEALIAARSSGWNVPVFAPPSAEDPLLRQELAGHPEWLDGLVFASGRMTAEEGPAPFMAFQSAYEQRFGAQQVGVRSAAGRPVVQPPDYAMYPYDFTHLLVAAIQSAKSTEPAKVLAALNEVSVEGANGDSRGFNRINHEGVVDDDVYFARFQGMTYRPVQDDALSATLPVIPQER
jgi:ABC-type branched-subunit amino acid transport system substrate-binding protein